MIDDTVTVGAQPQALFAAGAFDGPRPVTIVNRGPGVVYLLGASSSNAETGVPIPPGIPVTLPVIDSVLFICTGPNVRTPSRVSYLTTGQAL